MRNRLTVLLAQDVLLAATSAMYRSSLLRTATAWLHTSPLERVDRLKLGGIHRAQPFSHEFEKGRHHEYMLADWALLLEEQQVERYEYLRGRRVLLRDVDLATGGNEGKQDGGGGNEAGDQGGVGWMGDDLANASNPDCGVEEGWDGDYPDGYEDDPNHGIDMGGFSGELNDGMDGDDGGDGGGGGGGGDGGGGGGGGD